MKILVIGGMHGNEPLGIELVAKLKAEPIEGVDAVLANTAAIKQRVRFTSQDLNRSFPGDSRGNYEARRAAQLLRRSQRYDTVLDFHNTYCPGNDCGFVGESAGPELLGIAAWLGLRRVIIADYDCVNKYAPNCLSVEISLDSRLRSVGLWYDKLVELSSRRSLPPTPPTVSRYRFVYRMTLEDRDRLDLDRQNLLAFQPLPAGLARQMGVKTPAYPIFIGDAYTPYNYGGLLNDVEL